MAGDFKVSSRLGLQTTTILSENDNVPGSKFDSTPDNYTIEQLKRWLKCRGLKLAGKKNDLIARVNDCLKSGNHNILDPSIDDGKWLEAKIMRENNCDNLCNTSCKNISNIPVIPTTGWKQFPSQDIPLLFNNGHVYHYALESLPSFPEDQTNNEDEDDEKENGLGHMTDKPFTIGRKYVDSGFVHDMTDNKMRDDYYYVKAHVWPSMKNDFPHNVLVILSSKSGAVIHASCKPCKASQLGRCSHVVEVLLSPVVHVRKHASKTTIPCTSQECTCNKGKKRKKPTAAIRCTVSVKVKIFFIFSVDLLSRKNKLNIEDIPPTISLNRTVLNLQSTTCWNGSHYICVFKYAYNWFIYDCLKKSRQRNTGLSVFESHPKGYLISHVVYTL